MEVFEVINRGIRFRLEEAPEGGYFASVPDLPGCFSEGETLDEALSNIRDAMLLYVECAAEDGEALPEPFRSLVPQAS